MVITALSLLLALNAAVVAQAGLVGTTPNVFSRQDNNTVPNIPTACVPDCESVNNLLGNGCPPTQCCTSTFTGEYIGCYTCVASAAGVTDYSAGQETINTLVAACNANNLPVAQVFFPGQSSSTLPFTIQTQTVVSSLTGLPSVPSQTTVTSLPGSLSVPVPSVSSTTPPSGAISTRGLGMAVTWVLPLVAAGMGIVFL